MANEQKKGRKRLVIAAGALIGIGALATSAAFTDFGLINLGGAGGFGGEENAYNLQVSAGQEATVDAVANWVEANPDAEDVAPITGADSLVPGGEAVTVNLPVKNASKSFSSTLALDIEDTTPENTDAAVQAKNDAYASLLRIDIAETDNAASVPTDWVATGLTADEASAELGDLDPEAGTVAVVRVYLLDGATQDETNAANGGTVNLQAKFSGSSIN